MRLLLLGNGQQKFAGLRHFGYTTRFYNGLVRAGHCVYFFDGKEEIRQHSPLGLKKLGEKGARQKLIRVARHFAPDAIIIVHADPELYDAVREIRQSAPHIRVASLNVDALFSPRNIANINATRDFIDMTFCTTGGDILKKLSTDKNRFYFMPNVTDASIDTGRAFEQRALPVDFAAVMHEDKRTRENTALYMQKNLPGLNTAFHGFGGHAGIYGLDYINLLSSSAITLCESRDGVHERQAAPEECYLYSSDRIAHVMGNGSLALVRNGYALDKLYSADEAVFFDDAQDAADKVKFYIANPEARMKIAHKGWEKSHREFNATRVMGHLMDQLMGKAPENEAFWLAA